MVNDMLPVEASNMMSFRYLCKGIDIEHLIIANHILVEKFLVGYLPMVWQMIVYY